MDALSTHGLIAVLLIVRSKQGSKLVFHYPAVPNSSKGSSNQNFCSDLDSDLDLDDEDSIASNLSQNNSNGNGGEACRHLGEDTSNADDDRDCETLFGYNFETLESLMSPGRWLNRKKFEVSLEGMTFVGHPVFADASGNWSKENAVNNSNVDLQNDNMDDTDGANDWVPLTHEGTMTMFHVIFATYTESSVTAGNLYMNVAKKLSKALHLCQKQDGYVSLESQKILSLKAKGNRMKLTTESLWAQLVESSELAWGMKEIYEKVNSGLVARIRINGTEISLYCPAGSKAAVDVQELHPHSGLLLLEDKDILLRELSHPDSSPLAYFIREQTPTKSLLKHSTILDIPLKDIIYLAQHLLKWRKARSIMPLHPRNTYVVSPQARVEVVPELVPIYARRFAGLPPLPQMLKMLSGRPIKYGLLIPSKDHRAPFMDILAFFVRHGLVIQLKTYGWIKTFRTDRQSGGQSIRSVSHTSLLSPHLKAVDDDNESDIIRNPMNPTSIESHAIERLLASIIEPELRDHFLQMLPFFDGKHALEEIAAQVQGLKRAKVEEWLAALESQGRLLTFRSLHLT
ncbi:MAG: hypothetical protein FE78DRAFT_135741 [Acidomyces sp. 'richmondensis']|nr:MAG: hypothetical protein FE78DRAFT_135741 [Acidomyces sp. 'richmondensis']